MKVLRERVTMLNTKKLNYMICFVLSVLCTIVVFKLWNIDLKVPIGYRFDGDCKSSLLVIKRAGSLSDFFFTEQLGAPYGASNYDYPLWGDLLNILYFRFFVVLFGDLGIGVNVGFLLLVPLTSITAMYVMKRLGVNDLWAISGGITFSIIPYKFWRSTAHLFLNCYWQVPLAICMVIWLYRDKRFFVPSKHFLSYKRNIAGIFLCVILAYTGVYYAFFTAFFVCVMMLVELLQNKTLKRIIPYACVCILLCSLMLLGNIPYLVFRNINGINSKMPIRSPIDAEVYGMKITQLIIPNRDYGIPLLKEIREQYALAPLPNEGSEYLGIVGVVGFIILFLYLFEEKKKDFLELSLLNIAAVLLGTIGGIGSLFALFVSPQIRGYNRISVFIAFFSIAAFGLFLSRIMERMRVKHWLVFIGVLIYTISCLDQASIWDGQYEIDAASFYSDKNIVKKIEQCVSEDAMIYQWVYQPYPENPPIYNMADYASARGYLHSDTLKWSYGDQKGRESDTWNGKVALCSTQERVNIISNVGFAGIWIDTYAYTEEQNNDLRLELEGLLGVVPMESDDGRILFFDMKEYNKKYKEKFSQIEWEEMKEKNLTL